MTNFIVEATFEVRIDAKNPDEAERLAMDLLANGGDDLRESLTHIEYEKECQDPTEGEDND